MARTEGSEPAKGSKSQKARLSSDWSLQLDSMKLESLVIGDQHAPVNTFPGLVHTARHTMGVVFILRRDSNRKEESVYSGSDDWGEVVTR
jgi:hypothetical protein